jgi:hypothetical protein
MKREEKGNNWKGCVDIDIRDLVSTQYIDTNDFPIGEYRRFANPSVYPFITKLSLKSAKIHDGRTTILGKLQISRTTKNSLQPVENCLSTI